MKRINVRYMKKKKIGSKRKDKKKIQLKKQI